MSLLTRVTSLADQAPEVLEDLKARVQRRLVAELDPKMDLTNADRVRDLIEELFFVILEGEPVVLARSERQRLFEEIIAEILGFGPIEPLLRDTSVTEVMVNGPGNVFVERAGRIEETDIVFQDD